MWKRNYNIVYVLILAFAVEAATHFFPKKVNPAASNRADQRNKASEGVNWETFKEPGSFVMALARDGAGNIWIGTEGNGVWRLNSNGFTN